MTPFQASYALAYTIPSLQQQVEVAVIHDAQDIHNEDSGTSNHENRIAWSKWAVQNASAAWLAFRWPVATNPTIQASVLEDSSGATIKDGDVQYVVTANLEHVIETWTSERA